MKAWCVMRAVCGWRAVMLMMVIEHIDEIDLAEQLENALYAHGAEVGHIQVEPARRLTGPGLIWDLSGAVIDVSAQETDVDTLAILWEKHARLMLDAVGWIDESMTYRQFQGGINLAISAPQDQLHSAVLAVQITWHLCACDLLDKDPLPFDYLILNLKSVMAQEANPALSALIIAAKAQNVDILCDDDDVSIGHGSGSRTWPIGNLPAPQDVEWSNLHDIPLAMITGTNGKTTTTRLCAAIARAAGKITGLTTTDVVQVDEDIIDYGDYSGPGGARMLLRDQRVQIAFLEVARGGILRRGLATRRGPVAVVTNIAKDHLGEYGVMTLAELAEAKFAVTRALMEGGVSVLNADDPYVVDAVTTVNSAVCWFSLDPASPQIKQARDNGQPCAFLYQGAVTFCPGGTEPWSISVGDVPITLNGAARHNISNVLAAICVCVALSIPQEAIRRGLIGFASDATDNPGRFNEFLFNGARIFVDYAHNPHSIAAVSAALAQVPAKRRIMMLSQPGDRSDQDICAATTAALQFSPDQIVVAEIADYLRGRELKETPNLIATSAIAGGVNPQQISFVSSPSDGTKLILQRVQPDDLVLLLVLSNRAQVFKLLASQ